MWVDFRAADNFGFLVGNEWFAVNKLSLNLSKNQFHVIYQLYKGTK